MAALNWIDGALAGVLAVSVLLGLWRGFAREVLSLAGWVVAFVAAQSLSASAATLVPGLAGLAPGLRLAASFAIVFLLVLVVWALISALVVKLIHATPLRGIDRTLGAAFGAVRAVVVLLAVTTAVLMTPLARHPDWQASSGAGLSTRVLQGLRPLLPQDVQSYIPRPP